MLGKENELIENEKIFIKKSYLDILKREPDKYGEEYYLSNLINGSLTHKDFLNILKNYYESKTIISEDSDIAIIGPNPVPFVYGGAEKLYSMMKHSINKYSEHKCDLITIDSIENNFWNLIETYNNFFNKDFSKYGIVISTKYPSWMIKCNKHINFMQHTLRGLYDLYGLTGLPNKTITSNKNIKSILRIIRKNYFSRENFVKVYNLILKNKDEIVREKLDIFPGPFIKEIIHFFDKIGLSGCETIFAQSQTVKSRKDYFPNNSMIKILYPPIDDEKHECKSYKNYIFTASRFESLKRIDLLIRAFRNIKNKDIKFKIAGKGSEIEKFKELAKGDKRIEFLGFVSENKLINYYNNCLFVPFIPYDEDYGFVSIEAMKSSKPVLTCHDSGGPLEFVKDGITGLVANPSVEDLSKKMELMITDKNLTKKMGMNAKCTVNDIKWKSFVEQLNLNNNKKIIVLNTYPILPCRGGGQVRIFNIYKRLSKYYNIKIFNLVEYSNESKISKISNNLSIHDIPISFQHAKKLAILEKKIKHSVHDIAMFYYANLSKNFLNIIKKECNKDSILVCSHPYLYGFVNELDYECLIYEAHNMEFILKKQMLAGKNADNLVKKVFDIEKSLCKKSNHILVTSEDEKKQFSKLYGVDKNKITIIPNGVDCSTINGIRKKDKIKLRHKLGINNEIIGIFMGSWHEPNLEALLYIIKLAEKNANIQFFILGSVCDYYTNKVNKKLPDNVLFFGVVDDFQKKLLIKSSDFALNPMFSGSGTNLKIFEYLASELPVLTTKFGLRGLGKNIDAVILTNKIMQIDLNLLNKIDVHKNKNYIIKNFDWEIISDKYANLLDNIIKEHSD